MRGNADLIRELYALLERQEGDAIQELLASDFEFDVTSNVFNPGVWKGREGFARWMEQAGEVWLPPKIRVLSADELDDERVLCAILVENVGRESGVATTMPFWQLVTLRDGLVVRVVHFNEEAPARRAAGVGS
jgi:ketosteroid isomerase-like protein